MDAYASHLAQVNQTQGVVVANAIYNAQGQILVKEGTRVDDETAKRIARFKLMRPLEDSIAIENELTATALQECFDSFFNKDPSLKEFYQTHNPAQLAACCEYFCKFPLLRQKLTVISLLMPEVFAQSMFSAWMAMIMWSSLPHAALDQPSQDQISLDFRELFVAGLCHDIGMVHISPETLNKGANLNTHEEKQIQAHPVIGYNILKATEKLNPIIGRATLEHHEHLNGIGYPRGLAGEQLCAEALLLNLLDSVYTNYTKCFKPFERTLRHLIPVIQLSQHNHFGAAANALITLLKKIPTTQHHDIPQEQVYATVEALREHCLHLRRSFQVARSTLEPVDVGQQNPQLTNIQSAMFSLTIDVTQSGITSDAYLAWLNQVVWDKWEPTSSEVEEAFVMVQEAALHITKLENQVQLYLEQFPECPTAPNLKDCLNQLAKETPPEISAALANLWLFKRDASALMSPSNH